MHRADPRDTEQANAGPALLISARGGSCSQIMAKTYGFSSQPPSIFPLSTCYPLSHVHYVPLIGLVFSHSLKRVWKPMNLPCPHSEAFTFDFCKMCENVSRFDHLCSQQPLRGQTKGRGPAVLHRPNTGNRAMNSLAVQLLALCCPEQFYH